MGKLFGTDGVRGVANLELTAELAFRIGTAHGTSQTARPTFPLQSRNVFQHCAGHQAGTVAEGHRRGCPCSIGLERHGIGENLIAQRLTGVLLLEGFGVSHTKDRVLFEGEEEEALEKFLVAETKAYADYAKSRRGSGRGFTVTDPRASSAA